MSTKIHAVFPGTFDPITLGHVDLARRAATLFDRVTVAVARHHSKSHLLPAEVRLELVRQVVEPIEGVEAGVMEGLLVEGVRALGGTAVVRGVRGVVDLESESAMALTNRTMDPGIETVFLLPSPELAHISSTLVRQIASLGGDVSMFVPPQVQELFSDRFPRSQS